ncbi:2OG-Fe(II) oxygenase [Sphingomonas psychrolutea]|nr:2OG-Fe(II) oxygenase family protein [Sphingomonas psychrolutea]
MTTQDAALRFQLSAARQTDAANSFARTGLIRITEPFPADVAERLHHHLDSGISWGRTVSQGEKSAWDLTPEAIAALDGDKEKAFLAAVHETARDGFQFLFDSLLVSDDPSARNARGLLLDRVIDALNHPTSLDTFRTITGAPDIRRVNGQATRYLPGHFLTSHDDGIDGENRVAAYVINLTKGWRTDWGGLLQFQTGSGDVPLALKPGFNTIHLFRVPQLHSVSYVAPFAGVPRYAITGWLCR